MNSSDQEDAKKIEFKTSSDCNKMSEWLPHHAALESPRCRITVILSRDLFPKSKKGEGKEKIQSTCFLNGEFQKYEQAFILRQWLASTLLRSPCSSPSPFSDSLSACEQKHTAHPAQHTTPAKSSLPAPQLFSFTPTLFPGHALTAPHSLKQHRDMQTDKQALPLLQIHNPPPVSVIRINAIQRI